MNENPPTDLKIQIYGRFDISCPHSRSTYHLIDLFLVRAGLEGKIKIETFDLDTAEGAAQADFYEVWDYPTVLYFKGEEIVDRCEVCFLKLPEFNKALQRMKGELAPSSEIRPY